MVENDFKSHKGTNPLELIEFHYLHIFCYPIGNFARTCKTISSNKRCK